MELANLIVDMATMLIVAYWCYVERQDARQEKRKNLLDEKIHQA